MKNPCVYIMASASKVLYTGVTSDLFKRVYEHKHGLMHGFTSRYKITRLVHFEEFPDMPSAITREKQIKGWLRVKKLALVESTNPGWKDLSEGWYRETAKGRDSSLRSE